MASTTFVRDVLKPEEAIESNRIDATVVRTSFIFSSFGCNSLNSIRDTVTVTIAIFVKF